MSQLPLLAVTMGEPAGIGPEVALKAWLARHEDGLPPFFWIGGPAVIAERARDCGLESVHFLTNQKLAMMARRYLRDLRRDAIIDYR